jgi:hypothetical protein
MTELALRHHEVVLLMMSPLHHYAHKAESLELRDFLGVGAGNYQPNTV